MPSVKRLMCRAIAFVTVNTPNASTTPSCRLTIYSCLNLPPPTPPPVEFNPLLVLLDVEAWLFDREAFEPGIRRQKLSHRRLIARGDTPLSIFTQQILLSHDLSV